MLGLTESGGNRVLKYLDVIRNGVRYSSCNECTDAHTALQASPNDGDNVSSFATVAANFLSARIGNLQEPD
jgi:predicted peroxiredoxin